MNPLKHPSPCGGKLQSSLSVLPSVEWEWSQNILTLFLTASKYNRCPTSSSSHSFHMSTPLSPRPPPLLGLPQHAPTPLTTSVRFVSSHARTCPEFTLRHHDEQRHRHAARQHKHLPASGPLRGRPKPSLYSCCASRIALHLRFLHLFFKLSFSGRIITSSCLAPSHLNPLTRLIYIALRLDSKNAPIAAQAEWRGGGLQSWKHCWRNPFRLTFSSVFFLGLTN